MAKSVKKSSNADRVNHYENEFQKVQDAARGFEQHDRKNEGLRNIALQAVFDFGQQIRMEPEILEDFVRANSLPWNKVTERNPYNALVHMAFPDTKQKSWLSQCSNVLDYAHDTKINEPLIQWLCGEGGISQRYTEAVEHFGRSTTGKASRSKALRIDKAKKQLLSDPLSDALPGIHASKAGFFRSLVYFDGTSTRLVHVQDKTDDAATETYLLDLIGPTDVTTHVLAEKPLFNLYRAIDLIVGSCGKQGNDEERHILLWNETTGSNILTRLLLVSDAYTFAHAKITLAQAIPELVEQSPLLLRYADAQVFLKDFQYNDEWRFEVSGSSVLLKNGAKSPTLLKLLPFGERKDGNRLRSGTKLGRRTKHFRLDVEQMQSLLGNLQTARKLLDKQNGHSLTAYPRPKRFQISSAGGFLRLDMREMPSIQTSFLTFRKPSASICQHRELAIEDVEQLCQALAPYGDDVGGWFADSDVEDAALCIDHSFLNRDRFEYSSPFVISVRMDRTLVCEDIAADYITTISTNRSAPAYSTKLERDRQRRSAKIEWPTEPYSSGRTFGAFITSFLPNEQENRTKRKFDFEWQLEWWRRMTDIPVTVIASNWADEEIAACEEMNLIGERNGRLIKEPARPLIANRIRCLQEFYASRFDWGIIMDDDAALFHSAAHNSGAAFFSEMAANGPDAYSGIDVFYPINPGKSNSQGPLWKPSPELFRDNHVFDPEYDLKGSLFVVRNFRKEGRPEVLQPADFDLHGEDTLFAIEAIRQGCSVRRCGNIVLQEFNIGASHFPDRINQMKLGNAKIAEMYAQMGLRMSATKGREHNLDRSQMLRQFGRSEDQRIEVKKPQTI